MKWSGYGRFVHLTQLVLYLNFLVILTSYASNNTILGASEGSANSVSSGLVNKRIGLNFTEFNSSTKQQQNTWVMHHHWLRPSNPFNTVSKLILESTIDGNNAHLQHWRSDQSSFDFLHCFALSIEGRRKHL